MESKNQSIDFVKEAEEITKSFKNISISNVNDLVSYITPIMRIVKKYESLDGKEKKEIVIEALKRLVEMANLDDNAKAPILFAIDTVVPPMIDELFSLKPEDFKKLLCCC